MNEILHLTNCPVCNAENFREILVAKDYTVSGESFAIVECDKCTLRFTQDIPAETSIAPYYKSEDYISHSETSKGLINKLYHAVRNRTLIKKRKLIVLATGIKKGQHLDVGSGTGAFVNEMRSSGWNSTGLEPDPDARAMASQLHGIDLKEMQDFYNLEQSSFDAISLWHVLEHVHALKDYIRQLKMLLKEQGKLFIAVPNYTSLDAAIYDKCWAAYDVPRHLYHFSPASVKQLVEDEGMRLISIKPMWYDSFYISMLSSKYKHGKTNLAGAFFSGLKSNLKAVGDKKRCSSLIYVIGKRA